MKHHTKLTPTFLFMNWYYVYIQALVAISQVTKQIFDENPDFFPTKPMDYGRFLVISIGTGSSKVEQKYNANMASKWGVLGWLLHGGSTPLVDVFTQASADMVDFHNSVVFQALHSEENYVRIQVSIKKIVFIHSFSTFGEFFNQNFM